MFFYKILPLFTILILSISCNKTEKKVQELQFWGLGTSLSVKYVGSKDKKMEQTIINYVREFEKRASYYKKDSEISKINQNGYKNKIKISKDICEIIKFSIENGKKTGDKFDITYKSEGFLWDLKKGKPIPSTEDIKKYINLIGTDYIELDCKKSIIKLKKKGVKIDIGGVAKGYAIDKTSEILKSYKVKDFIINFGGDILICGKKGDKNWKIGVKDPFKRGNYIKIIEINNKKCYSLATSGDYERYVERGGKRYSHILDPKTGKPVKGAHSITVLGESATLTDLLATAISVGYKKEGYIQDIVDLFGVKVYTLTAPDMKLKLYK